MRGDGVLGGVGVVGVGGGGGVGVGGVAGCVAAINDHIVIDSATAVCGFCTQQTWRGGVIVGGADLVRAGGSGGRRPRSETSFIAESC